VSDTHEVITRLTLVVLVLVLLELAQRLTSSVTVQFSLQSHRYVHCLMQSENDAE
jgi:hypothetical protein